MKLFIDSANISDIKEANDLGIISGVTTNPSLLAKEKNIDLKNQKEIFNLIKNICDIISGPVNAEVISNEYEKIINEAHELAKINKNIVIKIPMSKDGLRAVRSLSKENIKTNMTLIFSEAQGFLAACAGASYVSPFLGRLDDICVDGINLIKGLVKIFNAQEKINTKIIVASIRSPMRVVESAKAGADIATVPYKIISEMINHPLTDLGIKKFESDFKN
jgi:transaldolase